MFSVGNQSPVRMTFSGNIRSNEKIAAIASSYIEADYSSILSVLDDSDFLHQFGFNKSTIKGIFIPNTYEIYWNSSAQNLIKLMNNEFVKFWNMERRSKLEVIGRRESHSKVHYVWFHRLYFSVNRKWQL